MYWPPQCQQTGFTAERREGSSVTPVRFQAPDTLADG
jgi:hypothetical protein